MNTLCLGHWKLASAALLHAHFSKVSLKWAPRQGWTETDGQRRPDKFQESLLMRGQWDGVYTSALCGSSFFFLDQGHISSICNSERI